jgi:hypothetical protein
LGKAHKRARAHTHTHTHTHSRTHMHVRAQTHIACVSAEAVERVIQKANVASAAADRARSVTEQRRASFASASPPSSDAVAGTAITTSNASSSRRASLGNAGIERRNLEPEFSVPPVLSAAVAAAPSLGITDDALGMRITGRRSEEEGQQPQQEALLLPCSLCGGLFPAPGLSLHAIQCLADKKRREGGRAGSSSAGTVAAASHAPPPASRGDAGGMTAWANRIFGPPPPTPSLPAAAAPPPAAPAVGGGGNTNTGAATTANILERLVARRPSATLSASSSAPAPLPQVASASLTDAGATAGLSPPPASASDLGATLLPRLVRGGAAVSPGAVGTAGPEARAAPGTGGDSDLTAMKRQIEESRARAKALREQREGQAAASAAASSSLAPSSSSGTRKSGSSARR